MQQNGQKRTHYFQNLGCPRHSSFVISFVCICHQQCDRDNLLCIECIDELNGTMNHQLVSVKKFTRYLEVYQRLSGQLSQKNNTKETVEVLRKEMNKKIDGIQFLLTGNISFLKKCTSRLKAQNNNNHQVIIQNQNQKEGQCIKFQNINSSINQSLSNKQQPDQFYNYYHQLTPDQIQDDRIQIRSLAKRKIWAKLNKKNIDSQSIRSTLKLQIDKLQIYTLSILSEMLQYSRQTFNNGSVAQKTGKKTNSQMVPQERQAEANQFIVIPQASIAQQEQSMRNLGVVEIKAPLKIGADSQKLDKIKQSFSESEEQSNQISSSCSVMTVKVIKKERKKYSSKYKRYTASQKNKIMKDIKQGLDRKIIAKKHKISTSTVARWERALNQGEQSFPLNQNTKAVEGEKQLQSKVQIDLL